MQVIGGGANLPRREARELSDAGDIRGVREKKEKGDHKWRMTLQRPDRPKISCFFYSFFMF